MPMFKNTAGSRGKGGRSTRARVQKRGRGEREPLNSLSEEFEFRMRQKPLQMRKLVSPGKSRFSHASDFYHAYNTSGKDEREPIRNPIFLDCNESTFAELDMCMCS